MQNFYTSLHLVGDPALRADADYFANILAERARKEYPALADQLEGALHIRVDGQSYTCGYYFVHAPSRAMCWLDEHDDDDMLSELVGMKEIWHLS
jgi:hypothetical protein